MNAALYGGTCQIVQMLIKHGADPRARGVSFKFNIDRILENSHVLFVQPSGYMALDYAIGAGKSADFQKLLKIEVKMIVTLLSVKYLPERSSSSLLALLPLDLIKSVCFTAGFKFLEYK